MSEDDAASQVQHQPPQLKSTMKGRYLLFTLLLFIVFLPEIITTVFSPWLISKDEKIHFKLERLSWRAIELRQVHFQSAELDVQVQRIELHIDWKQLIDHGQLKELKLQQVLVLPHEISQQLSDEAAIAASTAPSSTKASSSTAKNEPSVQLQPDFVLHSNMESIQEQLNTQLKLVQNIWGDLPQTSPLQHLHIDEVTLKLPSGLELKLDHIHHQHHHQALGSSPLDKNDEAWIQGELQVQNLGPQGSFHWKLYPRHLHVYGHSRPWPKAIAQAPELSLDFKLFRQAELSPWSLTAQLELAPELNSTLQWQASGNTQNIESSIALNTPHVPTQELRWSSQHANKLQVFSDQKSIGQLEQSKGSWLWHPNQQVNSPRLSWADSQLHSSWPTHKAIEHAWTSQIYFPSTTTQNPSSFLLQKKALSHGQMELKNFKLSLEDGLDQNHRQRQKQKTEWRLKSSASSFSSAYAIGSQGFSLDMPLSPSSKAGSFQTQLHVPESEHIEIKTTLHFEQHQFLINGQLHLPQRSFEPIPLAFKLQWKGQPEISLKLEWPEQEISLFTQEFGGPAGHLSLQSSGNLGVAVDTQHGYREWLNFQWQDGFFSTDDMSTMATGLSGQLHSTSLSSFSTGPMQSIGWEQINFDGLSLGKGELLWQWEKEQRLFIEHMKSEWCSGTLRLQAMRLTPPVNDIHMNLFCENLQLDELLQQFQVGDVEGEGALGGRLSVELSPDKLEFNEAYLYTTPSVEGRLRIHEAHGLDQAMSQNQLQLARECLKDYRYRWAKISFDTQGEEVLLKLEMDGKPAGLLPFRFNEKTAEFVYDANAPGVHLQGLKLNTNFRSAQLWPIVRSSLQWAQNIQLAP